MTVRRVPTDFATIALAAASSNPGDTILVETGYPGSETAHIAVENLTVSAPASVGGIVLILDAGVVKITLKGASDISVTGNSLNNTIIGNAGDNHLDGGAGQDRYYGGAGDDVFGGGGGADLDIADYSRDAAQGATHGIISNQSARIVQGGVAQDTVVDGFGGTDSIIGIRNVTGSNFADKIYGGGHANALTGLDGNDLVLGNKGADTINGGEGNDRLSGGLEPDKLTGGGGADVFVYAAIGESTVLAAGRDLVLDFSHVEGDKIDLHVIDADSSTAGNQIFSFIGTSAFSHLAGELRYQVNSGNAFVYGDVDGNGAADFSIALRTVTLLEAGDFIL